MNPNQLLRWLLLLIVGGSLAVFAVRKSGTMPPADATRAAPAADDAAAAGFATSNPIVVTYFTTDVRCDSCRTIERLTSAAMHDGFAAEIAAGKVVFRVINTDRPEHQHFVDHYEITNKTVIVSRWHDGVEAEWQNRQDIWLLLEEPVQFADYVSAPVREYLSRN